MKAPRKASLDFIRQFAHSYCCLPKVSVAGMIIN